MWSLTDIKISNELEWVRTYLRQVKHLVPVETVPKILAIKANREKLHNYRAVICRDEITKEIYYISLYLFVYRTRRIEPFIRYKVTYSKIDILIHLAHELAHLEHWHHTPDHIILQNKINNIFMAHLKKTGYISEEYELKYHRPKYPTL